MRTQGGKLNISKENKDFLEKKDQHANIHIMDESLNKGSQTAWDEKAYGLLEMVY